MVNGGKNYENYYQQQIALLTVSYGQNLRLALSTEMKAFEAKDLLQSAEFAKLALDEISRYIRSLEAQLKACRASREGRH